MAKTTSFLCRLPTKTYESLQSTADTEKRSMNSIVVDAVEQYLAASPGDAMANALYSSTRSVISQSLATYSATTGSSLDEAIKQLAGTVEVTDDFSKEQDE